MSVINTQPLVGASGQSTGYTLSKSLRFRSSASAYMNRTPASATNRRTYTWSGWIKRGKLSASLGIFEAVGSGGLAGKGTFFNILSNDQLAVQMYDNTYNTVWNTSAVFRDPSAWYHIVLAVDTTQASQANMVKIYVNGVQQTSTVTHYSATLPQNYDTFVNNTVQHNINTYVSASYGDQYYANVQFIDGSALTPSSFGATDATTGAWQPIAYTGSYGTNGFYLPFTNTTSTATLGNDSSGNSNTWTVNNISLTAGSTYDSMTDVPTLTSATAANYCVMNPLDLGQTSTLTEGNLRFASSSNANYSICRGSIGVSSGKWYWEVTANSSSTGNGVGIAKSTAAINNYLGSDASGYCYFGNGEKYNNGTGGAYGATFTTNDVIGVALDMDAGTLVFYKNNTSQGTAYSSISGTVFPSVTDASSGAVSDLTSNFGQRPFAYTPPSGYVALNTYNL